VARLPLPARSDSHLRGQRVQVAANRRCAVTRNRFRFRLP